MPAGRPGARGRRDAEGRRKQVLAVLLDIDDTLVDTRGAFAAALEGVLGEWLPHLGSAERGEALLRWATDPRGHFRAYTRGEVDLSTQRHARIRDLYQTFGGPTLSDADLVRWSDRYEELFLGALCLRPGALDLLGLLESSGVRVGAVTNLHRAYQRVKLERLGLVDRLPLTVCLDDLGFGKPRPEVFRCACERLGVPSEHAAYVGDELDVDARGARDAGLTGVWVDTHGVGSTPGDVLVARTLADVPGVLLLVPPP